MICSPVSPTLVVLHACKPSPCRDESKQRPWRLVVSQSRWALSCGSVRDALSKDKVERDDGITEHCWPKLDCRVCMQFVCARTEFQLGAGREKLRAEFAVTAVAIPAECCPLTQQGCHFFRLHPRKSARGEPCIQSVSTDNSLKHLKSTQH